MKILEFYYEIKIMEKDMTIKEIRLKHKRPKIYRKGLNRMLVSKDKIV